MDFMGDTANAGRLLEAAVSVDPHNASAATSYASFCFSRKGDPAAAAGAALELEPF
jgi:cytochrome c-type biogenesis protein CcmH/NrfG